MVAGAHLLSRQIVPIRQEEQEFFGLGSDALLIYVERLRTADNLPIFLENMFFPYQTYRGLMTEDLNNRSIFQVMKQIDGRTVNDTSRRTLEIAKASPKQAQKLGISTGEPLLFMNCYFIDQEGHPLCIGRQYYVGSRYMFERTQSAAALSVLCKKSVILFLHRKPSPSHLIHLMDHNKRLRIQLLYQLIQLRQLPVVDH